MLVEMLKNIGPDNYYVIVLIGSHSEIRDDTGWGSGEKRQIPWTGSINYHSSNFLNYKLLETNTNGFFYPLKGIKSAQAFCWDQGSGYQVNCQMHDTVNAFFIEGSKIPGGNCVMKISTNTLNFSGSG